MDKPANTLNLDRFGKVWSFAESVPHGHDNAREREAALGRADSMAKANGLTLDEAVARLRRSWGETGSCFPLSPMERMIETAGVDPRTSSLTKTLALYGILMRAIPFPGTIRAAVSEFELWDGIEADRVRSEPSYRLGKAAAVRRSMMATFISDHRATSVAEAVARAAWVNAQLWRPGRFGFQEKLAVQTMADDVVRMGQRIAELSKMDGTRPIEPGTRPLHQTSAMKRAAVSCILDEPGGDQLSLREVAERVGVSPETVRTIKRKRGRQ